MKIIKTKQLKAILFIPIFFLLSNFCQAQSNPYLINFETGFTHPASKSYASTDTVWLDSIPWKMPGVFLGAMTVNDFYNGSHAARMRLTNNTTGDPSFMEMLANLPNGVQKITFWAAMYNPESGGKLLVFYSIDSGQNWLPIGDTITINATPTSPIEVVLEPAINHSARIKIAKVNVNSNRIDIDDIAITRFGTGNQVLINNKEPVGTQVSIFTDSLKIYFDHPISAGTGSLTLHRSQGGTQQITIPSNQLSVQDSVALISGISLQDNSHYYILLSDSTFVDTINHLAMLAITDTTFWQFNTEDTIAPPDIPPLKNLSESFLACNESQNLIGLFKSYNLSGNQTWQCTSEGHEDSFAVAISGGFGKDVSAENKDWLISELPFDLSTIEHPVLSFWQKASFDGNVIRSVKISTNYLGGSNPTADSVTWITLNVPGINQKPSNQWEQANGIDLSAFKNQPFYLAFTYSCGNDGAYKLFYDDIRIESPTSISTEPIRPYSVQILGLPQNNFLNLQINSQMARHLALYIFDEQGRLLLKDKAFIKSGENKLLLQLPELSSGLYWLKTVGNRSATSTRFLLL